MGRSRLFAVVPEDMRADPVKFKDIINATWGMDTFECTEDGGCEKKKFHWDNHDQKVSDMFIPALDGAKVYLYLTYDYTVMFEKLFRNLMMQNPDVPKMEWHFLLGTDLPYCISIKREDMIVKSYAVQLVLGKEESAFYFDSAPEDEGLVFNQEKYLSTYPKHMATSEQLVNPRARGLMDQMMHMIQSGARF